MAQICLKPPKSFNSCKLDDRLHCKWRFQQWRKASSVSKASVSKQISTLLYCLGGKAEVVLTSSNVIYEQAKFNRHNQQCGETAKQYIMVHCDLAKYCDYGKMSEEMIRDHLLVEIHDTTLSEKLQLDSALTLESAKKVILTRERPCINSSKT